MSQTQISQYYSSVDKLIQFGGSRNESTIRNYFITLINQYAEKKNLLLVPEIAVRGTKGKDVKPDGTLKNVLRLDYGYWESKDEADDLDEEIDKKQKKGYPMTNILFEDSKTAALIQGGEEVMRVNMRNPDDLDRILNAFISFKSPTARRYEEAIEQFQRDIPTIIETLRTRIDEAGEQNTNFIAVGQAFLELCKAEINPEITLADIREMMIQHILTSDIFNKIFDDPEFHRHNNIASELEKLIGTLFNYSERRNLLGSIEHYYEAINAAAASVADHHEKQKFLKALYENFYKAYNPKAADRLGVVYTPNEIVDFMIDSTNYLLEKHFKRQLWDKNVEILDPATGTGTFVCNIIDKCPAQYLAHKYKNELHANEVAILPYYIANLNVEYTFKQKMGYYEEFPNLCFVDTLDNIGALKGVRRDKGVQIDIFGLSSENTARIKRQNEKKISVVIGNPPYNANQANENENNKNREYEEIDKHIKETYIKYSTAQKTKVYDMYARFYRWSMDRIDSNGIIAFITNRSFIDSRTFDGFRKCVQDEFSHCYIVDTHSDVRANPKIAGTTHNVFGIQTGVAIMFLVKKEKQNGPCKIEYTSLPDEWRKEEKWSWFRENRIEKIEFESIVPDKKNNWINLTDNDWEELIPLTSKSKKEDVLFQEYTIGSNTARDEWVYSFTSEDLQNKIFFFIEKYNEFVKRKYDIENDTTIKWTRSLKNRFSKGKLLDFSDESINSSWYRPFNKRFLYHNKELIEMPSSLPRLTSISKNLFLLFSGPSHTKPFQCYSTDWVFSFDFLEKTTAVSLFDIDSSGNRIENITEWGLEQFRNHYGDKKISREEIFHYIYAVFHNPAYRKKYELNLKREFPRIPFYTDFKKWVAWGKKLMDLHIGYETVKPFALKTVEATAEPKRKKKELFEDRAEEPEAMFARQPKVKAKLKADKQAGVIELDEQTMLTGIPREAWDYKLGNRSALEWVLDQYKEKKPSDPTIAEKFNTYRFADYKEKVIDLLKRVCTVSVETMKVVREMEG